MDAASALERNRESPAAIERFREAEQECRAAERLEPENGDVQLNLSYLFGHQLEWDEAIKAARKAVSLNQNNATAHAYLGIALCEGAQFAFGEGLIDEAWREAEEEVNKRAAGSANVVGRSSQADLKKSRKANLDEAIAEFREALRLNDDYDMAHYNLGYTLVMADNPEAGIAEYREALLLNPNNSLAHSGRGHALGNKGDLDGAISETRAAIQLDPSNPQYHFSLARWLERKRDWEGALGEYRETYTRDPQNLGFKGAYESSLRNANAAREQDKLQHWLGIWVFAGPVKLLVECGGTYGHPVDIPNYPLRILRISPSGEVAARVGHIAKADEDIAESIPNPKADWSAMATDTSLVLTMDPIPPSTVLSSSRKLKEATGRLEVHREGEHYIVEFTYYEAGSSGDMDCHTTKKFLGSMGRP